MQNEFNSAYQYDRCVSRGICSINPTTASLLEIIILYLRYTSFYGLKLEALGISDKRIHNLILNTISILSSNYEISTNDFTRINSAFQEELPRIIKEYENLCEEKGHEPEKLKTNILLKESINLTDYIRLGEKEFNKRIKEVPEDIRNLYRILFVLVKSMCINILTFESYGEKADKEIIKIMRAIGILNNPKNIKDEIKNFIYKLAVSDCNLMKKLVIVREKMYGIPQEEKVSFSTVKGKAMLVVGSNIRELEQILDRTKDTDIDVYTHDNMILAHTYPKFKEYKNLKGQFGQGLENCLLDFSTFPGPVILTRHSLFNVENLYRGRLFSTDLAYSKGVIQIKDNDFSEVIKSAKDSKGFKTGKKCPFEKIGFSYDKVFQNIKSKFENKKYSQVFIIGIQGYTNEDKEYFKNMLKHIPDDVLVVSMSCCKSENNIICLNTNYDIYTVYRITKDIKNLSNAKITLFFPYCNRHSLSIMLFLSRLKNIDIYFGVWNQTIINPNIAEGLKTDFCMNYMTTPKNDLSKIIKN